MRRNQHLRFRVLEHIAESLVGIFEVEWGVGSTSLVNSQHSQRELLETVKHDAHEVVGLYAEVYQLTSQGIRVAVHLAVGQLAVPIHHSGCIGRATGLLGKEVGKGLAQVHINLLARTYLDDALCLLVADDADAVNRLVWLSHHVFHGGLDGISHHTHLLTTVHRQTRLHTDIIVLICQEDVCQHVVKNVTTILLHQGAMCLTEMKRFLPARQSGEVERDARVHTQVTTEVREGISQLRECRLHLLMHAGDIVENGLLLLDFHHKRDGAHEHAVSLLHPWVVTSMIDGGIGHLLLSQQASQHIAESCLEELVGCKTVCLAPVVHHCTVDIGRLLSHLSHRIVGMRRQ